MSSILRAFNRTVMISVPETVAEVNNEKAIACLTITIENGDRIQVMVCDAS